MHLVGMVGKNVGVRMVGCLLCMPCCTNRTPAVKYPPPANDLLPPAWQMSEEGISACYVNSHSFVHDIVTLSTVSTLGRRHATALQSRPDGKGGIKQNAALGQQGSPNLTRPSSLTAPCACRLEPQVCAGVRLEGSPETQHSWFPGQHGAVCRAPGWLRPPPAMRTLLSS